MDYLKKCMKNGWFLSGMIGLIGLIVVYVTGQFGIKFDYAPIENILTVFLGLLAGVGIITSPSDKGILPSGEKDSEVK